MKYENYKDYFYEGTEVLKNKSGITNQQQLNDQERSIVALRISEISLMSYKQLPGMGNFDFNHLKAINRFLFQDLYEWAGEMRKCEMEKLDIFCLYSNLEYFANSIFEGLKKDEYYIDLSYSDKLSKLADLFGDINALHPFREGNGRTQREFIEELAKVNGIDLDLTHIGQIKMIEASHRSMYGDNSYLLEMFNEYSSPSSRESQLFSISNYCEPKLAKKLINRVLDKNKKR